MGPRFFVDFASEIVVSSGSGSILPVCPCFYYCCSLRVRLCPRLLCARRLYAGLREGLRCEIFVFGPFVPSTTHLNFGGGLKLLSTVTRVF